MVRHSCLLTKHMLVKMSYLLILEKKLFIDMTGNKFELSFHHDLEIHNNQASEVCTI